MPPPALSVALLECDHVDVDLRTVDVDYGDMFVRLFADHAPHLRLDRVDVVGGAPLPAVGEHDAVLVTGSRSGVDDPEPWIEPLRRHLRALHAADVPTVGICFGHQLIADALGGRVERAGAGWGVGVHTAHVQEHAAWMTPRAASFALLVSHQDQVVELPSDARLLAICDHAPVAAFQVGSLVGLQGHPEFRPAYAQALMERRRARIGDEVVERARATLAAPTDHPLIAGWIAGHFASAVGRHLAVHEGGEPQLELPSST